MKLITALDHLAAVPTAPAPTPRRALLAQLGRAAAAALPAALVSQLAAATPLDTTLDVVSQLLLLTRLQKDLYTRGLAASGLIPAGVRTDFQRIQTQLGQHEAFFVLNFQNAGASVPAAPVFDFSGRRGVAANPVLFSNVLTGYDEFLALAQQLEDLGVRLFQSQAFAITTDGQLTKAILRIYAVKAQHSAHVRGLRRGRGAAAKNWPSDTDAPIVRPAAAAALVTAATVGEGNAAHFLVAGTSVPFYSFLVARDNTAIHDTALPEAFDEPISAAVAQAAINLFS